MHAGEAVAIERPTIPYNGIQYGGVQTS